MIDANQRWDVAEAIERVSALAEFKPLWPRLYQPSIWPLLLSVTLVAHY